MNQSLTGNSLSISPKFYRITCDKRLEKLNGDELYHNGICKFCLTGSGDRLQNVSRLVSSAIGSDVAYTRQGLHTSLLFSVRVYDLLRKHGLKAADFAPVTDKAAERYYEICPQAAKVSWVGLVKSVCVPAKSVFCPECRQRSFVHVHKAWGKGVFRYISQNSVFEIESPIVVAGFDGAAEPLLNSSVHEIFSLERNIIGLGLEPVGIVPMSEVSTDFRGDPVSRRK